MASYADDEGLFWVTEQRAARGKKEDPKTALRARLRSMTFDDTYLVPPLTTPPPGFMAYDWETTDPEIHKRGPSWAFPGVGCVLGLAVAWENFEAYYPLNHCSGNVENPQNVMNWFLEQNKRPDLVMICANAVYDVGFTRRELGVYPVAGVCDVQFCAALIDEYRNSYSFDSIARTYLGVGKVTDRLKEIEKQLSVKHGDMMACLAELPGPVVAPYSAGDAREAYDLHKVMLPVIERQGLMRVHLLESKLIPMSTEMRRIGMRVDVDKADATSTDIKTVRIPAMQDEIKRLTGVQVEPWEATTIEKCLEKIGIKCNRTAEGGPEVKAEWLEALGKMHPVPQMILRLRKLSKAATTFLDGHILYHQNNGRLHAEFNQLRSEREDDGYGTVTGRYSVTGPGLQQIPVRDPEIGPMVRSMFLPEEGEILASLDYSSQEPRLALHFAFLANRNAERLGKPLPCKGAEIAVQMYIDNPRTDYHQFVADLCGIPRPQAKTLNLGLAYGMGGAKLARSLGLPTQWMRVKLVRGRSVWEKIEVHEVLQAKQQGYDTVEVAGDEAKRIIKRWEEGAPFVRGLFKECDTIAKDRGFICTLLRRRCRFPEDGNGGYQWTHKSMNRLCQSSAADQTKLGMEALWDAGIVPRLTVHDELVFSVPDKFYAESLVPYMVNAARLEVPSVVDVKIGENWGAIPK